MDEATDFQPPTYSSCDGVSARCPVEASLYGDYFNLGACIFFVVAYALLLIAQLVLGLRARTWSFSFYLAVGTICELMGYAGRIALTENPWNYDAFVIQLVLLILGPTFVAAAISITFKYLVLWYGPEHSVLRPSLYPWVFVGTDFFSIAIQAVGGVVSAIATGSDDEGNADLLDVGSDLLVAGVVFQLANMVCCGGLMVIYLWRRQRSRSRSLGAGSAGKTGGGQAAPSDGAENGGSRFDRTKIFVYMIIAAYVLIIIRCIYRVPEMADGWGSNLMQNETLFLVLDGAMILLSVTSLTILHPYFYFNYMSSAAAKDKSAKDKSGAETDGDVEEHCLQPIDNTAR